MNLRDYYSNFREVDSLPPREFSYSCISNETGKRCLYKAYLVDKREQNVSLGNLEEIEEILHEMTNSADLGVHHDKYIDYMIKTSSSKIKIETVTEYNSKAFQELDNYELSIFFYNLRTHIKNIIIGISYLKSRFIGDARWLKIENLGFNPVRNHIVLKNFLNISFEPDAQKKETLNDSRPADPSSEGIGNLPRKRHVLNNFSGKSGSISFRSIRHSQFFDQKRCPYLRNFLQLIMNIASVFSNNEEIFDYFNWNRELFELEKRCFTLFLEDIFNSYRANLDYRIEEVIKQEYFDAQSYKELEEQFKEGLQNGGRNQANCPTLARRTSPTIASRATSPSRSSRSMRPRTPRLSRR